MGSNIKKNFVKLWESLFKNKTSINIFSIRSKANKVNLNAMDLWILYFLKYSSSKLEKKQQKFEKT